MAKSNLFKRLKTEIKELRAGTPGNRFIEHYRRQRRREKGQAGPWKTAGYVSAGILLLITGFLLSLPPGVPGFLLWIPGLGLLVGRFERFAQVLDRGEMLAPRAWSRVKAAVTRK
jgi:hypothetical protein